VSAGDALVTLEAMKMENELRAAHAGTIAQVAVGEGTKVEGGALLIVIRSE
jgi:biotin carboxyl carrier protein